MKGKKILVLGFGLSGRTASKYLQKENDIYLYDDFFDPKKDSDFWKEFPKLKLVKDKKEILSLNPDFVLKSPGIRPDSQIIRYLKEEGIKYYSDIELAFRLKKSEKIIAVTGTNGKTTTSLLIEKILKDAGIKAKAIGNIGLGAVEEIGNHRAQVYIIEASSFQLEDIECFKPDIALITNLGSDHLDYHGSIDNYQRSKLNILKNLGKNDILISDYGLKDRLSNDKKTYLSLYSSLDQNLADIHFYKDDIYFQGQKFMNTKNIKLLGLHNIQNIINAILVGVSMKIDKKSIVKSVEGFSPVSHRLEFVGMLNGISYYNDSKSTNVNSADMAIKSFDKPLIILMGGYDKGEDFTNLLRENRDKIKELIVFGQNKEGIKKSALEVGIKNFKTAMNLQDAFEYARNLGKKGDIILLSPGSASWDMYSSYIERGQEFRRLVEGSEKGSYEEKKN